MKAKLCGWAGCNKIVTSGKYFCEYHQNISDENRRKNAFHNATRYADYHDPLWRSESKKYLNEKGCCEKCGSTEGLQVHHIIPVRYAPQLFMERANWQVLCRNCHQAETAREIGERKRRSGDR